MIASFTTWTIATLAHVLLASYWAGRLLPTDRSSRDERLWMAALLGTGSLAAVLHLVALTVGLSLVTGVAGLILWNTGVATLVRGRRSATTLPASRLAWQEMLACTAVFLLVISWSDVAGRFSSVDGTDAAHYHVPNAVNYALGASPFDLPATQHLYPVGGSVIAAWFIVPVGTPLVIDLAMVPAFLVMLTSLNWLFRLATGLSGLGHASWLVVALAATPLVRMSSLVSGDLWFTASYLALTAALVTAWSRRAWTGPTVFMAALATGLLAGSKTSGSPAAALLLGTYVAAEVIRFIVTRQAPARPRRPLGVALAALALTTTAGGIWIIRNWIEFGSPLAPSGLTLAGLQIFAGDTIQPTTYLSVLGDQQTIEGYDVVQRLQRYAGLWLGRPFIFMLWPACLIPVDLALTAVKRRWTDEAAARLMLILLVVIPGLVLLHVLAGAPWTSLEWTRGFSLRYALPVIVGVALTGVVGALPLSVPWYREPLAAGLVVVVAAGVAGRLFLDSLAPGSPRHSPMPPGEVTWVPAAVVLAVVCWWASGHRVRAWVASLGALIVATAVWVPTTAARHHNTVEASRLGFEAELSTDRANVEPHRLPLVVAIDAERAAGRLCVDRRFFTLSRFDLPLLLQTPDYRSQVFYAGRDVDLAENAGPLRACDYVVASAAMMDTNKGPQLLEALVGRGAVRRLWAGDQLVVYGQ